MLATFKVSLARILTGQASFSGKSSSHSIDLLSLLLGLRPQRNVGDVSFSLKYVLQGNLEIIVVALKASVFYKSQQFVNCCWARSAPNLKVGDCCLISLR